jgi:hypothetical protein
LLAVRGLLSIAVTLESPNPISASWARAEAIVKIIIKTGKDACKQRFFII